MKLINRRRFLGASALAAGLSFDTRPLQAQMRTAGAGKSRPAVPQQAEIGPQARECEKQRHQYTQTERFQASLQIRQRSLGLRHHGASREASKQEVNAEKLGRQ